MNAEPQVQAREAHVRLTGRLGGEVIEIVVTMNDDVLTGVGAVGVPSGRPDAGPVRGVIEGSVVQWTLKTAKRTVTFAGIMKYDEIDGHVGGQPVTLSCSDDRAFGKPQRVTPPQSCNVVFNYNGSSWSFFVDQTTQSWKLTGGAPIVNKATSGWGVIQGFLVWPSWVVAAGQIGNFTWDCIHFDWQPGSGNSAAISPEYSYIRDGGANVIYCTSGTASWP